jgi:hypothetical protein
MYVIDDCYVGNAASNADSAPAINMPSKSGEPHDRGQSPLEVIENNCPHLTADGSKLQNERPLIGTPVQVAGWSVPSQGHHHMSLHPQLLANAPFASRSGIFRLKALFSEQRAEEACEPRSRADWTELAIEWHMMANLAANANGESIQIDVV